MQNSLKQIDQQLITSNFCSNHWYNDNNLEKTRQFFSVEAVTFPIYKIMTVESIIILGFLFFFSKRWYFSMQNSLKQIDQQLITSNFCSNHWYNDNIYLMFWKPGPNSPRTPNVF